MENRKSATYCIMPYISLAVQNYGDFCACNESKVSYQLNNKTATVNEVTPEQVWNSPTRMELAAALSSGIQHSGCKGCWAAEAAGNKSLRQRSLESFGHLVPDETQPKILIIKPGNVCNAACRICNPATSSSWYSDSFKLKQLDNKDLTFKIFMKEFEGLRNGFDANSPNFWPGVANWHKGIEYLEIYGGEPWLTAGLWKNLKTAIDSGDSKHIDIAVHTNSSMWNAEYLEILTKFRKVKLELSIDSNVDKHFNYMRYKLDFDSCMQNAKKFVAERKTIDLGVTVTVSNLNVWYLDTIYDGLRSELGINIGISNVVSEPEYFDIRHLPTGIKLLVTNKLKHRNELANVLRYMNSLEGDISKWNTFCAETNKLDNIRGELLSDVMPEWYNIIKSSFPNEYAVPTHPQ